VNGQLNISYGRANRDAGIERAMNHAESVHRDWKTMAWEFFLIFLKHHKGEFMCEDVRAQAVGIVPEPPTATAWGGIMKRARCAGLITTERTGKVKNPNANCANAAVWKKL
jgi:hypothetical protein